MYDSDITVSRDLSKKIELDINKSIGSLIESVEREQENGIEDPRLNKDFVAEVYKNYFDVTRTPVQLLAGLFIALNLIIFTTFFGSIINITWFLQFDSFRTIAYYFIINYDEQFIIMKEFQFVENFYSDGGIKQIAHEPGVYFHLQAIQILDMFILSFVLIFESHYFYFLRRTRNYPYKKSAKTYVYQELFQNVIDPKVLFIFLIFVNLIAYNAYIHPEIFWKFTHLFYSNAEAYSFLSFFTFFVTVLVSFLKFMKRI